MIETRKTNMKWVALWIASLTLFLAGIAMKQPVARDVGGIGLLVAIVVVVWRD